ncbi:hypothetical protein SJAG_03139 [Schizosaccharomyces japonicus yFS275]|uniref:Uncharacterized protein n=1 Tax=Schizosaccharomyces japonicus (strain yFS275 / FY16936) TaxID=402676 RepID=B6K3F5_SCHJY|nr:hypothetical protein SJAG_03139 [Schizosaccharomyces japonicus yFS275]EEB08012.1 hypothetical protein SJAG_03139 [Schizosaccharomyces japonicus yFS275]
MVQKEHNGPHHRASSAPTNLHVTTDHASSSRPKKAFGKNTKPPVIRRNIAPVFVQDNSIIRHSSVRSDRPQLIRAKRAVAEQSSEILNDDESVSSAHSISPISPTEPKAAGETDGEATASETNGDIDLLSPYINVFASGSSLSANLMPPNLLAHSASLPPGSHASLVAQLQGRSRSIAGSDYSSSCCSDQHSVTSTRLEGIFADAPEAGGHDKLLVSSPLSPTHVRSETASTYGTLGRDIGDLPHHSPASSSSSGGILDGIQQISPTIFTTSPTSPRPNSLDNVFATPHLPSGSSSSSGLARSVFRDRAEVRSGIRSVSATHSSQHHRRSSSATKVYTSFFHKSRFFLLFTLGIIIPPFWLLAALLPIPEEHSFKITIRHVQWRMINRVFSFLGVALIFLFIGLGVSGSRSSS